MSHVSISGPAGRVRFRPGLQDLEDRTVPATLVTTSGAFDGADAPVIVLGTSDDGQQLLLQSTATNLVPGQVDIPNTNDLFYFNRATGERALITAFDAPAGSLFTDGTKAVNASVSTPGVLLNALISADGSAVAFMSGTDATLFDATIAGVQDGGGEDMFVFRANPPLDATSKLPEPRVVLASRDKNGFALGSYSLVTSPSISADGKSAAFVSTTSAHFSYDTKFLIFTDPNVPHGFGLPNLYRTEVGQDTKTFVPVPVTYQGPFTDGSYFFYDDVSVDPLGRYASGDEVSFVTMNTGNSFFFPGQPINTNTNKDVTRFTFAGGGFNNDPLVTVITQLTDGTTFTNSVFTGNTQVGGGTAVNAFVARDRSDIVLFTATVGTVTTFDFFGNPTTSTQELVPGYVNQNGGTVDVYRATFAGLTSNVTLVSRQDGTTVSGANGLIDPTPGGISITPNGTRVLFTSTGTNIISGLLDKNKAFDVFQADLENNVYQAISVTAGNRNRTGFGASRNASQTTDGLLIAFESDANDLSGRPDANGGTDVFVRDLPRATTSLGSIVPGNFGSGNGRSFGAVIGGGFRGGQLYYSSLATDLDTRSKLLGALPQVFNQVVPLIINNAPRTLAVAGGPSGFATITSLDIDGNLVSSKRFQPFIGFRGELRVASGDFTGDGVPDLIVGAGAGGGPRVQVIDGFTGRIVEDFFAFESTFTGGIYVASGDFNADGRADLIVGAGELGGPRVQVYDSATRRLVIDRFAFEPQARVGVHVAAGDFTGDGLDDLIVAAGIGGGPRVRVLDGSNLNATTFVADFFAFDPTDRAGAYVSAGDFDNDGLADIVTSTGPGVETRVRIYNAANLNLRDPNVPITFRDFSPFGAADTGGARAVLRDIEGGSNADLVVSSATGLPRVATFAGNTLGGTATSAAPLVQFNPFGDLFGEFGAYVG